MPFDLLQWKLQVHKDVERFARDPLSTLSRAGITSVYGFLLGSTIFPIAIAHATDPSTAIAALVGISSGLRSNLLANWIQTKYDQTQVYSVAVSEAQQPELAPLYDAIAQATNVFPMAIQSLNTEGRLEYVQHLHAELKRYGKLEIYLSKLSDIQQSGSSNIQGSTVSNNRGPVIGSVQSGRDTMMGGNIYINYGRDDNSSSRSPLHNSHKDSSLVNIHENREHLQELLMRHMSRLRVLELQGATFGVSVPPHVTTEIADIRAEIVRIQQLLAE